MTSIGFINWKEREGKNKVSLQGLCFFFSSSSLFSAFLRSISFPGQSVLYYYRLISELAIEAPEIKHVNKRKLAFSDFCWQIYNHFRQAIFILQQFSQFLMARLDEWLSFSFSFPPCCVWVRRSFNFKYINVMGWRKSSYFFPFEIQSTNSFKTCLPSSKSASLAD